MELQSQNQETMMNRSYRCDTVVIVGFIMVMWVILTGVLLQVVSLLDGHSVKIIASISALIVGIFCTASLVAVLVHLKHKRKVIYGEDVHNLLLLKGIIPTEDSRPIPVGTEALPEMEG